MVADDLIGLDQANLELEGQRLGYKYQTPRGDRDVADRPASASAFGRIADHCQA